MIFLTIIRASIAFGLLLLTHLTEKHQKWTGEAKWQISSHFFLSWRRIHLSLLGSHLFGLVQNYLFPQCRGAAAQGWWSVLQRSQPGATLLTWVLIMWRHKVLAKKS